MLVRACPTATQNNAGPLTRPSQKAAENGRSGRQRCAAEPVKRGTNSGRPMRPEAVPLFFTALAEPSVSPVRGVAAFCVLLRCARSAPANSASLLDLKTQLDSHEERAAKMI